MAASAIWAWTGRNGEPHHSRRVDLHGSALGVRRCDQPGTVKGSVGDVPRDSPRDREVPKGHPTFVARCREVGRRRADGGRSRRDDALRCLVLRPREFLLVTADP